MENDWARYRDGLVARGSYWNATPEQIALNTNGCGTDGWKGALVPDTIYGLCVTPSCLIHDWDYACADELAEKQRADMRFLGNMLYQIRRAARKSVIGWALKIPRSYRAFTYFIAVAESPDALEAFQAAELIGVPENDGSPTTD